MEEALKDDRFSHILSDPRFRKMPKHIRRVALDKRMKKIFKDSSFKGKCELDKRGRPLNLTPTENLKKLYDVASESSDDDEEEEDINENAAPQECKSPQDETQEDIQASDSDDDDEEEEEEEEENEAYSASDVDLKDPSSETLKIEEKATKRNLSVEESEESSSEESDDSESESDESSGNESEDFDHRWEELRNEAPDTNEATQRLAVCNMDWDRIRAVDLLVCFDSFKPSDGHINSVKIYPSEYGLKRMEEEKLKGPPELVEETLALDEEELQDRKGSKYHREKLRQYQISRLKYFYAVVDCDSPETANVLYEQLNGMEYESSSVRFDLRFIPDDITFDHEPTSSADKLPDPTEYKPRLFVTSALQQVKVDLTWDETDPKRTEFFQKIFTDPDSVQSDIQEYLASASSESEAEVDSVNEDIDENMKTKDRIAKYRELLLSLEEKEKEEENKYDIEVTWQPAVKQKAEEQVKEKMKKDNLNPFEEILQKKRLKKKEQKSVSKQEEDSLSEDSDDEFFTKKNEESSGKSKDDKRLAELALIADSKKDADFDEFSKKKKKKDKSQDLDNFVGDANDPRFAAMYTSSLFNMVPTNQNIKKKNESKFNKNFEKKRKFKPSGKFKNRHKKAKY